MQIIQFENEPKRTPFAPEFNYFMYESTEDMKNLRDIVLEMEDSVIHTLPFTSDWNTGLGENSMTSRSDGYNILKWQECHFLKEIIRTAHDNFITELGHEWENVIYVQCWGNVLRKGQHLKQHQHWTSPYTYIGGHICLGDYDTQTYYVNPYTQQTYSSKNESGKITLFPNWLEHYTNPYMDNGVRVSIAFDIITEIVYNEDIFDNRKDHWVAI